MFNFFLPRKTKQVLAESELILASLQRNRIYTQDIMSEKNREAIEALEARYPALLKARDIEGLEKLNKESMKLGNKFFPPSPWDGWRENVEVFVVAAIMALSIRTFFLQPFKIPTGSMEPTLYGIEPTLSKKPLPNPLYRAYDFLINGRTYSRVVTEHGGKIIDMKSGSFTIWFDYTDVTLEDDQGHRETQRIWIRLSDVEDKLGVYPFDSNSSITGEDHEKIYKPGEELANYVTQTGDQVLVDKVTYNFRPPRRGEVFIFKTAGIPDLTHANQEGSQDFIKRCVGLQGDLIKVTKPFLFVNGSLATGAASFDKQFKRLDDYPGYTTEYPTGHYGRDSMQPDGSTATYYVPANCYWAMGDNSPHSDDSRYWGGVPRENLVGRGYFVFWPFTSRWGWIR